MDGAEVPYDEIDEPVVELVRALNGLSGVETLGSCGGHPHPTGTQAPEGSWWVLFALDRSDGAWLSLELLAWLVNHDAAGSGRDVLLFPDALPPHLTEPGRALRFVVEGHGEHPRELAGAIRRFGEDLFTLEADSST